ncbi:unnamed protein product [Brassicogethes aeneus]|uniref:NADP-dependent oxidoreductase domain-containing protein n=1 Tax=Brassicogethes aeneus TaxID=1431903 RepID=A0A9P0B5S4_BRAAE|nr:unnamed protein product [Brassicogethes aeneus]
MSVKSLKLVNGRQMPLVGLGTWEAKDPEQLETVLDAALELGYRHIDTAYAYGNEKVIGQVIKKWISQGKLKREDIFITTKLLGSNKEIAESKLLESLKNLDMDYVDLYLVHFPVSMVFKEGKKPYGGPTDHIGLWKILEKQVELGRARAIGLSNFNKKQIERLLASNPKVKPANLQIENHVYLQQRELVEYCQHNGITVTAYSPLGNPGYNKFAVAHGLPTKPDIGNMLQDKVVSKIANNHQKSNAQVMLRYQIQRDIIVIPKTVTVNRLAENYNLFDWSLTNEEMQALNDLDIGEKSRICDWAAFKLEGHEEFPW